MGARSAFQRGVAPVFQVLLAGKEEAVLSLVPDESLRERIETLARKSTEDALTPAERAEYAGYVELFNPRLQKWDEHFERSGVYLLGKTAVGRTKIQVFNINSEDQLALRSVL